MPYQATKPLATDQLSQSQADIATNFTLLGTVLNPDNGLHLFPAQPGGYAPVTGATTVGLVAKPSVAVPANTALYFVPQTGGGNPIDFTTALLAATGWCRLPCGIRMRWGSGTTGTPIDWSADPFTAIYSVVATLNTNNEKHTFSVSGVGVNGFNAEAYDMSQHAQAKSFYYMAIGI